MDALEQDNLGQNASAGRVAVFDRGLLVIADIAIPLPLRMIPMVALLAGAALIATIYSYPLVHRDRQDSAGGCNAGIDE
jgi:hypothetical protein